MELSKAILWIRRYHGYSQEKLAHITGISPAYIRAVETQRRPSPAVLSKLATGLKLPLTFFYFLKEIDDIKEKHKEYVDFMLAHYPLLQSVYEMEAKSREGMVEDRNAMPHLLRKRILRVGGK